MIKSCRENVVCSKAVKEPKKNDKKLANEPQVAQNEAMGKKLAKNEAKNVTAGKSDSRKITADVSVIEAVVKSDKEVHKSADKKVIKSDDKKVSKPAEKPEVKLDNVAEAVVTVPVMVTAPPSDTRRYLGRRTIAKHALRLERSSLSVAAGLRNEYKLSGAEEDKM